MGFTRYWDRTEEPFTEDFLDEVREVILDAEKKGIHIYGWNGKGFPEITMEHIRLNGNRACDLDHETFALDGQKEENSWDFCKTARKPYDFVVREILKVAEDYGIVENVSEDDENNEIISDEEYRQKWHPKEKGVYVVTNMGTKEVLGVFSTNARADDYVFDSGHCSGISTRTEYLVLNKEYSTD